MTRCVVSDGVRRRCLKAPLLMVLIAFAVGLYGLFMSAGYKVKLTKKTTQASPLAGVGRNAKSSHKYLRLGDTGLDMNLHRIDCDHPVFGSHCDALPNYFLHPQAVSKFPSTMYKDAVLAFVHAPKSGGTTVKSCMTNITSNLGREPPYLLHTGGRFEAEVALSQDNAWLQTKGDLFIGSDAWGFCRTVVQRRCAYAIMFREPYDRLISLYFECRKQNTPPGRGRGGCVTTNITHWAVTFKPAFAWVQLHRQLFCSNEDAKSCKFFASREDLAVLGANETYLHLVADSLSKSFAVIGMTEDFESTYRMLKATFDLPFPECKSLWENKAVYSKKDSDGYKSTGEMKRRMMDELRRDEEVAKFLYPDLVLYEKAKEIFARQKEVLGN